MKAVFKYAAELAVLLTRKSQEFSTSILVDPKCLRNSK